MNDEIFALGPRPAYSDLARPRFVSRELPFWGLTAPVWIRILSGLGSSFFGLSLVRLEIPESLGRVTAGLQVSTQTGGLSR